MSVASVNPGQLYFLEQDSTKAAFALPTILKSEGLWRLTCQFNQLVKQTDASSAALQYVDRFSHVIAKPPKKSNPLSRAWANLSFKQFVRKYRESLMIASCYAGNIEMVKLLYTKFQVSLYLVEEAKGDYPLVSIAVQKGHDALVRWLIQNGAPLDLREKNFQRTALHFACEKGRERILEMLLKAGADANARDIEGNKPLKFDCITVPNTPCIQQFFWGWLARQLFNENADLSILDNFRQKPTQYSDKLDLSQRLFKYESAALSSEEEKVFTPQLPADLWNLIFDFLPKKDLIQNGMQVSRLFYNLVTQNLVKNYNKI